jgi:hypothetical protein
MIATSKRGVRSATMDLLMMKSRGISYRLEDNELFASLDKAKKILEGIRTMSL